MGHSERPTRYTIQPDMAGVAVERSFGSIWHLADQIRSAVACVPVFWVLSGFHLWDTCLSQHIEYTLNKNVNRIVVVKFRVFARFYPLSTK